MRIDHPSGYYALLPDAPTASRNRRVNARADSLREVRWLFAVMRPDGSTALPEAVIVQPEQYPWRHLDQQVTGVIAGVVQRDAERELERQWLANQEPAPERVPEPPTVSPEPVDASEVMAMLAELCARVDALER